MNFEIEEFDKDALGNPIVIGNIYGYASNHNGFTHIVVGKAKNVKKKVSLEVISFKRSLYNHVPEDETQEHGKTITTRAINLFPVNLNK